MTYIFVVIIIFPQALPPSSCCLQPSGCLCLFPLEVGVLALPLPPKIQTAYPKILWPSSDEGGGVKQEDEARLVVERGGKQAVEGEG